jgi:hypothetical protein
MIRQWLSDAVRYIRNPSGVSEAASRSIREEIEFHLAESARERIGAGAAPTEACQGAVEHFGDVEAVVRGCHEVAATGHARWHRLHLTATAVLLAAVAAIGGLAWSLSGEPPVGEGDITGRVVDEQSNPIANAHVLAVVKTWPQQAFHQQPYVAVTKSEGTFEIENVYPLDEKYEVQIAVVADGKLLESSYVDLRDGRLEPLDFRLTATDALTLRFESRDGQPLAGVEVFPFERIPSDGARHMVYFCSGGPVIKRSDGRGRVSMPYFSPGDSATIYMRMPGGEWKTHLFQVVHDEGDVVVVAPTDGLMERTGAL